MTAFWFELIGAFLILLAGGLFSAGRFALTSARSSQLESSADEGDSRADVALRLLEDQGKFTLAVEIYLALITITITAWGIIAVAGRITSVLHSLYPPLPEQYAETISIFLVILIIAAANLLALVIIPKRLASGQPLKIALQVSRPIELLSRLAAFPMTLLTTISALILKVAGKKIIPERDESMHEKIIDMLDEVARTGEVDQTKQDLIKSVFEFSDTTASQCLTPRTELAAINLEDPIEKVLQFIREEGFSRFPVYKGSLDQIVGVIFTRDIINILFDQKLFIIYDLIRPAYFVPDSKKISEILRDFQARQIHMAIVLDEFGGTAGIITIEDILEEIVGEIQDEYDTEEMEFKPICPGLAEVSARMHVDEFNKFFGATLPEGMADTIGGLIFYHLGELPLLNQKVLMAGIKFEIAAIEGNRIKRVMASRIISAKEDS